MNDVDINPVSRMEDEAEEEEMEESLEVTEEEKPKVKHFISCVFCHRGFTSRDCLRQHIGDHLGHKPFLCNLCGRSFARNHSLKAHLLSHQAPSIECDVCLKTYASETVLRRHMKNHDATLMMRQKKGKIKYGDTLKSQHCKFCFICSKSFETEALLQFHMDKVHKKDTPFVCDMCPRAFPTGVCLTRHMEAVHMGLKPFECELCERRFRTNFLLKLHVMDHTGELPYACKICSKRFKRKDLVARHELTHTKGKRRAGATKVDELTLTDIYQSLAELSRQPNLLNFYVGAVNASVADAHRLQVFDCSVCNAAFLTEEARQEHQCGERVEVAVENIHECPECFRRFSGQLKLASHMRRSHPEAEATSLLPHPPPRPDPRRILPKQYKCKPCGKVYLSNETYLQHMNEHCDLNKGKFQCTECPKSYTTIKYLRVHMGMHGRGGGVSVRKRTCPTCAKVCITSTQLREHILSHLRAKPKNFFCDTCGRGYANRRSIVEHVKMHQAGAQLRECALCDKAYVSKDQLRSHICRVHFPDSKPYVCDKCGKAFKTQVDLNRHVGRHVTHLYNCNTCHQKFKTKLFLERHMIKHEDTSSPNLLENLRRSLRNIEPPLPIQVKPEPEPEPELERLESDSDAGDPEVHKDEGLPAEEPVCSDAEEVTHEIKQESEDPVAVEDAHICTVCFKVYYDELEFKSHCSTHRRPMKNLCSICGTTYPNKLELEMHLMFHKGEPLQECQLCDRKYPNLKRLRRHVLNSHMLLNSGKYVCNFCHKVIKQKRTLEAHVLRHLETHTCPDCGKVFGKEVTFNQHKLLHLGLKPFTCEACDMGFRTAQQLKIHTLNHDKMKMYQCEHPECGKKFRSKVYFKRHEAAHLNPEPFICNECGKSFILKKSLDAHIWTHRDDCPYKCTQPGCGKISTSMANLRIHMLIHNPEKAFICVFCQRGFNAKCHLQRHLSRFHQEEEGFQEALEATLAPCQKPREENSYMCSFCGKNFNHRSNLVKHINLHTGNKPVECPFCPKKFNHNGDLRVHLPSHTGERFACSHCPKSFQREKYLQTHIKAAHSGQAQWVCEFCSKSFVSKVVLTRHLTRHTGIKPFACHVQGCGRGFHSQLNLEQHLLTHDNANQFQCHKCDRGFPVKRYLTLHLRLHDENPRFKCDMCDKVFITNQHLLRHFNKHEPREKLLECNICFKKFLHARGLEGHMQRGKHSDVKSKLELC